MSEQAHPGWSGAAAAGSTPAAQRSRFASIPEPAPGEFDALADLFLGPGEFAEARRAEFRRPLIEAIVLGHLPVLAPAWVKQYAAHRAREFGGAVGLVRVSGANLSVELVGEAPELPGADSLKAGLNRAAQHAVAWLIRSDEPGEPVIARHAAVNTITLLSGADEAALVACYRAFKGLGPQGVDAEGPALRVAWMGCTPAKATEAMQKLGSATQAFLSRPVEDGGCLTRIDAARSTVIFQGESPEIGILLDMLAAARAEQPQISPMAAAVREAGAGPSTLRLATLDDESDVEAASDAAAPEIDVRAMPEPAPTRGGRLASHISGLSTIGVTCPDAPSVEIAFDASGCLHLLAQGTGEPAAAVADLTVASAWAVKNRSILVLAFPGLKAFAGGTVPVRRLFTDRPKTARSFGDADIRLHVLLAVEIEGKVGWACAELN